MSLRLASLFQDHAVLQRDQRLPVWGWAPPFARIRVALAGNEAFAISGDQGDWLVRLPALPAGGPHVLTVDIPETGERLELRDILIGEVWLASGQSNMDWTLAGSLPLTADVIATADFPAIRLFNVNKRAHLGPQRTVEGTWQVSSPTTVARFSAVGFSFARRIHRELGIPVGIVNSSWGGSIIQSWTSRSTLAFNPDVRPWLEEFESMAWTAERWKDMQRAGPDGRVTNYPADPGVTPESASWNQPTFDDSAWDTLQLPSTWQSAGHAYSGVFWFRRTIELPETWVGRDLQLHLGAADKHDITFVNGVEVGRTGRGREEQHWDTPRTYAVPAAVVTGRTLTLAVRVYSFLYDGGLIGPADRMRLRCSGERERPDSDIPLAGAWRYRCEHNLGVVVESHVMGHGERNSPHMLFDNMVRPLVPYALRGALWYQGESNANDGTIYARLMRDLIEDWRRQWGLPELAFHLVQLPGFQAAQDHQPDSNWSLIREAQTAALALPHTGLAVTIDLGEAKDIHPKNKIPVGERLAQSVLSLTYGQAITPCGPLAEKFTVSGDSIRCEFLHTDRGLTTTDGAAPRLFFIAGDDQVFHPANARIDGHAVVVTCPAVPRPVAVRYAWANNPEGCNLANQAGLPASPFRSDRW